MFFFIYNNYGLMFELISFFVFSFILLQCYFVLDSYLSLCVFLCLFWLCVYAYLIANSLSWISMTKVSKRGFTCVGGIMASEVIHLLWTFYDQGDPNGENIIHCFFFFFAFSNKLFSNFKMMKNIEREGWRKSFLVFKLRRTNLTSSHSSIGWRKNNKRNLQLPRRW